ncbi:MAG: DUF4270 domain-containing protein [Bacteroidota bacterium]
MKKNKKALYNFTVIALIISSFIACDKDFTDLESDTINRDNAAHFSTNDSIFDVIAYTKALGPVQTNALPVNAFGVYKDPNFGTTTASLVTELNISTFAPDFGENTSLDSVVLTIPYFSTLTSFTEEGVAEYDLDSVFGTEAINISLFESNYFLRNINPSGDDIDEPQIYYSNRQTGIDEISISQLEGTPIPIALNNPETSVINPYFPSNETFELIGENDVVTVIEPALRLKLNNPYWQQKIIDIEGEAELSTQANFKNYFRGIYLKAEALNGSNDGNMILLNLRAAGANITLHYTRDNTNTEGDRINSTYVLNFNNNDSSSNIVNFLENDFTIQDGNDVTGDENLFLKGQQGSYAEILLFNGDTIDDVPAINAFEKFKEFFVETEDGNFIRSKRLVNEANLVFNVNQDLINGEEPDRLYLFDATNNFVLADYDPDARVTSFPQFSNANHLGILERDESGNGISYKMRITNHINNLLINDFPNVKLGLAVSANVDLELNSPQYDVLTNDDSDVRVPVSSVVYPRSTVIFGNNTINEDKKLYLEVFYTEPDTE